MPLHTTDHDLQGIQEASWLLMCLVSRSKSVISRPNRTAQKWFSTAPLLNPTYVKVKQEILILSIVLFFNVLSCLCCKADSALRKLTVFIICVIAACIILLNLGRIENLSSDLD